MSRLLAALLALGGSFPAAVAARTEIRLTSAAPVAVRQPRAGAVLAAGGEALLSWQPLDGFRELGEVDEWEAFLSLDGGASYPLRITPQLDLDLRRVLFRVPNLTSDDARLLFHFGGRTDGGERVEIAFELTRSLRIAPAPSQVPAAPRWTLDRGQEALPGDAGVVGWTEGSRRGAALRSVVTIDPQAHLTGYESVDFRDLAAWVESEPPAPHSPGVAAAGPSPPRPRATRADSRRRCPPASREILLQTSRLNE